MPKNETIDVCGVPLGMFKAKVKPWNIYLSLRSLSLKNIKNMNVWVHECVRITKLRESISQKESKLRRIKSRFREDNSRE